MHHAQSQMPMSLKFQVARRNFYAWVQDSSNFGYWLSSGCRRMRRKSCRVQGSRRRPASPPCPFRARTGPQRTSVFGMVPPIFVGSQGRGALVQGRSIGLAGAVSLFWREVGGCACQTGQKPCASLQPGRVRIVNERMVEDRRR